MEGKRGLIVAALLSLLWLPLTHSRVMAQSAPTPEQYRCRIYGLYISGNMDGWLQTLKAMQQQYARTKSDSLLIEILKTQYGYIPWAISNNKKKEAEPILENALKNIDYYLSKYPNNAEAMALKSSFLGFKIALNPLKGPFIGPKTVEIIDAALKIAPRNPWVILDKANAEQYTPKIFGGDPQRALTRYRTAIDILNRQGNIQCSWNYLNAYINLAFCYTKLKQYDNAMQAYNKLLEIAPNFKWVKDELIPQLREKKAYESH